MMSGCASRCHRITGTSRAYKHVTIHSDNTHSDTALGRCS